uniref:Uncharacterized protein n=1 Tax=Steinernema glaseri TaxID=37863 RepID=A0A1I8A2K1_9BILA
MCNGLRQTFARDTDEVLAALVLSQKVFLGTVVKSERLLAACHQTTSATTTNSFAETIGHRRRGVSFAANRQSVTKSRRGFPERVLVASKLNLSAERVDATTSDTFCPLRLLGLLLFHYKIRLAARSSPPRKDSVDRSIGQRRLFLEPMFCYAPIPGTAFPYLANKGTRVLNPLIPFGRHSLMTVETWKFWAASPRTTVAHKSNKIGRSVPSTTTDVVIDKSLSSFEPAASKPSAFDAPEGQSFATINLITREFAPSDIRSVKVECASCSRVESKVVPDVSFRYENEFRTQRGS